MTRKHFQALAYAFHLTRPRHAACLVSRYGAADADTFRAALAAWSASVDAVADACKQANVRFDRDKFISACNADSYSPGSHGR